MNRINKLLQYILYIKIPIRDISNDSRSWGSKGTALKKCFKPHPSNLQMWGKALLEKCYKDFGHILRTIF